MPNIEITVRNREIMITGDTQTIVNGNSNYALTIDADAEWAGYSGKTLVLTQYLSDGTVPTTEIDVSSETVPLPAFADTHAAAIQLKATNNGEIVHTSSITILCERCITDGSVNEKTVEFDVYNAMMEYIAGKLSGSASAESLTEQYEALLNYQASLPDTEVWPSRAYRRAIAAPARKTKLTGTITLTDGATIELTNDVIAEESVGIIFDCMPDGFLIPGGTPSSELTFDLDPQGLSAEQTLYAAEIRLLFWILLPSTEWYEIPLGVYTCVGVQKSDRVLHITAYDDINQLGGIKRSDLSIVAGKVYTPQEIITLIAETAGIEYNGDVSGLINSTRGYVLSDIGESAATARDLLGYTAQVLGAFAYIDRFRKLRVVPVTRAESPITVDETQRMRIETEQTEYRTFEIDTVITYPDENGMQKVQTFEPQSFWEDGVTAELPENPLFPVMDAEQQYRAGFIHQCLNNLIVQLDPVVFTPVRAAIPGDPSIEPYEWRTFTRAGESYAAPITMSEWRYSAAQTIESCGADAIAGLAQSRAEKQALAARIGASQSSDNATREMYLRLIQSTGHVGMEQHTHEWLAHFTHGELGGE